MQQLLLATARPGPARLHVVQDNAALETCLSNTYASIYVCMYTCMYMYAHMYACTYVHAPTGFHPHSRTLCVCTGTFGAFASV